MNFLKTKTTEEKIGNFIKEFKLDAPVFITQPRMPELSEYNDYLKKIWATACLTNEGPFHREFEQRLKQFLDVQHINLFTNGTIALLVALQALRINSGEVITTPFTFPATTHVLYWNHIRPVFCDLDPKTFNIDPAQIEKHISPDTKAILAVHVYGTPCDVEAIQAIADRHGLSVIYDAAHAFGVRVGGKSILDFGDFSALSFHATKLFTTIEGGALVSKSKKQKERIDYLKNFGIAGPEAVIGPGINGKMNEFQASFGLLELDLVNQEIADRKALSSLYRQHLQGIDGIAFLPETPDVQHNFAYFPIFIDSEIFGLDRDALHEIMNRCNIMTRKYFYPLCSDYPCYSALFSAHPEKLPVAQRAAQQVLVLPLYGKMERSVVETVAGIMKKLHEYAV